MERGLNRIYSSYFLKGLRAATEIRAKRWDRWQPMQQQAVLAKSIRDFDGRVTAPMAGFSGADEYYQYSSVHQRLHQLRVPTTIVADLHDPIVPFGMFRDLTVDAIPNLKIMTTQRGGHLGYYEYQRGHGLKRWADQAITHNILASMQH